MTPFFSHTISIVTGAASGIGLALTRELAARGSVVVMADRSAAVLEAAAASLRDAGLAAASAVVDVTDAAAVRELVADTVARHGKLDYLFNNAGISVVGDARDLSLDDWHRSSTRTSTARSTAWPPPTPSWQSRASATS
jgi:NADP-dependent 3-hydroxy acid dehydrogenase YdfG